MREVGAQEWRHPLRDLTWPIPTGADSPILWGCLESGFQRRIKVTELKLPREPDSSEEGRRNSELRKHLQRHKYKGLLLSLE